MYNALNVISIHLHSFTIKLEVGQTGVVMGTAPGTSVNMILAQSGTLLTHVHLTIFYAFVRIMSLKRCLILNHSQLTILRLEQN